MNTYGPQWKWPGSAGTQRTQAGPPAGQREGQQGRPSPGQAGQVTYLVIRWLAHITDPPSPDFSSRPLSLLPFPNTFFPLLPHGLLPIPTFSGSSCAGFCGVVLSARRRPCPRTYMAASPRALRAALLVAAMAVPSVDGALSGGDADCRPGDG